MKALMYFVFTVMFSFAPTFVTQAIDGQHAFFMVTAMGCAALGVANAIKDLAQPHQIKRHMA